MSEDLDGGILTVVVVWLTKLCADVVCPGDSLVASQRNVRVVAPLLGNVLDQGRRVEAGLWEL